MSYKQDQPKQSGGDDTQISSAMLNHARQAILKRVKLDRTREMPYLAGYSRDGKTIYIGRNLPRTFAQRGRRVPVDQFLMFHEAVEKALVDKLGLAYQHVHQIALRAEEAAVKARRVSWEQYQSFCEKNIDRAYHQRLTDLPPDLDLEPYRDEQDWEVLNRMQQAKLRQGRKSRSKPGRRAR